MRELQPGTAIVAPRGDVNEGGALRFFRRLGMGRYDMADLATRTEAMAEFVEAHVAAAKPSEVIGLGYSNGANILASLIFARPTLFTKAVLMHPYIPWTPAPEAVTTEILITAGERDPICPPQATRDLDSWFRAQGTPVETAWEPGGHEISRGDRAVPALTPQGAPDRARRPDTHEGGEPWRSSRATSPLRTTAPRAATSTAPMARRRK
jgi:phospholipase/carboxylesterase